MEWGNILGIITAIMVAVGLPLALRKRKKAGPQNVDELFYHLQGMGVKVSRLEAGAEEEKVGVSRGSGQRSEGVIKVEERNIDFISVSSTASQYGTQYSLHYLVNNPSRPDKRRWKRTRMVKKKNPAIWGRVVDIQWRGDDYLSQELNFDYQLKDRLLQVEPKELKGSIWIFPELKYEYARVRTNYCLPSFDLFEAVDIIAGHIKSGW